MSSGVVDAPLRRMLIEAVDQAGAGRDAETIVDDAIGVATTRGLRGADELRALVERISLRLTARNGAAAAARFRELVAPVLEAVTRASRSGAS